MGAKQASVITAPPGAVSVLGWRPLDSPSKHESSLLPAGPGALGTKDRIPAREWDR